MFTQQYQKILKEIDQITTLRNSKSNQNFMKNPVVAPE